MYIIKRIYSYGTIYYLNNEFHREDGPACEYHNGNKLWYQYGKLHRADGPAVDHIDGHKQWWLNDIYYGKNDEFTNESWQKFIKTIIFS